LALGVVQASDGVPVMNTDYSEVELGVIAPVMLFVVNWFLNRHRS
jgi:hypothetical protein